MRSRAEVISALLTEVAPAPPRSLQEQLGVTRPKLGTFDERERCAERVGIRHRVIRFDPRRVEHERHVRESGVDDIPQVANRLVGNAVAMSTAKHVVDLAEVDPRHQRTLLREQVLDERRRRLGTIQISQHGP